MINARDIIRSFVVPTAGRTLDVLGLTKNYIRTSVIRIYAGDIPPQTSVRVIADMHIGGVHDHMNVHLMGAQNRSQEIIKGTNNSCFDLGDRLTLGSKSHRPTQPEDIENLSAFWETNAKSAEGGIIHAVRGNHERGLNKRGLSDSQIAGLHDTLWQMGVRDFSEPIFVANDKIQLLQLPSFDALCEIYPVEMMKNLICSINAFPGLSFVLTHNPDGVHYLEQFKNEKQLRINNPTLFLSGHTHGLLGFPQVPIIGKRLSHLARKWLQASPDTPYFSGYYPSENGEPYGIYVSQGMGDQKGLFRVKDGGREFPHLLFIDNPENADIVL